MKKQIAVSAFLCVVFLSSGFLLGRDVIASRQKNQEPYTPTRKQWANLWLESQAIQLRSETLNLGLSIEDLGEGDELKFVLLYRNSVPLDIIEGHTLLGRDYIKHAQNAFGIDVVVVEKFVNLDDKLQAKEYKRWLKERSNRRIDHKKKKAILLYQLYERLKK